ncbi:ATP-binding protein [Nitrincola nitratireducens]|uniref:histidine kinase n=1 Tax=Nitrincola nitratireducens TaxID=1229521 RepID=W9V1L1_9GAMM|nr:ATP-binding protein [Nitrincola nitratireducens]EXJ10037.1 Sensor protein kinase walK [Nitrincola nitratireducens]
MTNLSLSMRIILLVLVISSTLVGGMLMTVYKLKIADYELVVSERNVSELHRLATELELTQQQRVLGLEAFAARLLNENGELLTTPALKMLLNQPSVAKELFPDGLLVFDSNATAIAESQFTEGRLGTNYADRPHFRRAQKTKTAVISEPILGRVTGVPLISYLQPVLSSEGEILAYAGGSLDLANTPLLSKSSQHDVESNSITFIIDPQHRLFVSMRERFEKPEPLPKDGTDALVDAALNLAPPSIVLNDMGQSFLVATMQLSSPNWIVLRAVPYSEVIAPAQVSFRQFLFIALILTTLIAIVGVWLARNLTQSLEKMTKRIEEMADNGLIDEVFPDKGNPEVKALAHAMNRLAKEQKVANLAVREVEQFLTNVLDSASEISIIATDKQGVITVFNKGAEMMLGYKAVDLVGKETPACLHLMDEVEQRSAELSTELGYPIKGFRVFVEKAEQTGAEKREWTYVHKNQRRFPVSLVVTPMRNDAGEITGYLGIAEDITEPKRLDKMKSEFISTVSHELRTPLTSISGALGLLVGGGLGELPEKALTLLATAYRNSKRLTNLINDLLDIEKITSGKLHYDMEVQALMPLIEQAVESNQDYGRDRGIRLLFTSSDLSDTRVYVDSQRFMQVLANLLSNAIKFSPDKGEVRVKADIRDRKVIISVIDKGRGIADSFRSKIFQRFAQADASDTRAKEGTGLGLAITRELVEKMGGRIDFESEEGKGARFFVELPIVHSSAVLPTFEPTKEHVHRPRVLHIEDDADLQAVINAMLGEQLELTSAHSLEDARRALSHAWFDVVLLDIALPDGSGWDLLPEIRASLPDAKIIVLSSSDLTSHELEKVDLALLKSRESVEELINQIGFGIGKAVQPFVNRGSTP